jgi:S1-C subfamily serine protease
VQHAWLGVEVETIDPELAQVVRGLPSQGVVVTRVVKGSPAAAAGLVAATRQVTVDGVGGLVGGDAIVALDGKIVTSSAQLAGDVTIHKPGDEVQLELVRNGAHRTVDVTVGNAPAGE